MRRAMLIAGMCGIAALTACNTNNSATEKGLYNRTGNTINVNDDRSELYNRGDYRDLRNVSADFGYVRHQRSGILGDGGSNNHYAAIDREQLADIIGKYCTDVPNVDDVSTLVTDEEVLIVYKTDSKNRYKTADQVKKMAMSVVPRWYHVYVTDNERLRKNVENFATLDSNSRNIDSMINGLVKQMLKSPQGREMNNGENANGETRGGINDNFDRDNIRENTKTGK
ncbi:YhcN/YlaJ family sporulation lipoprotein [Bacillus methanolicus]|uniref:Sporulation lipoprotein YhcN/YlaJ-like protein n=1 Tax=Bacillus methanolicus (strain MGA3 / ATCC 53907) TaxID=796606 RepID=I3DUI6_BACMM|nr:YhcN/YlaJ family sporulation lipoprotein [Bacillus methanolicus]AIE61212.1 Sporulation lipoprotein YhcN/YlaJ-like protein [Bacillus methanolicus MGA3]EIJ77907.1 putative lipoprotein [Bacillus methanolicus MGA3]